MKEEESRKGLVTLEQPAQANRNTPSLLRGPAASRENVLAAMDMAESIHEKNGIKLQGGKKYSQVVHRIEAFRRTFGFDLSIETDMTATPHGFVVKAFIKDYDGRVIATGYSYSNALAKEKALEKLETTAIGRALANCGLGGGEYASLDEMESFPDRYEGKPEQPIAVQKEWDRLDRVKQNELIYQVQRCSDRIELEDWLHAHQVDIDSLPEPFQDTVNHAYNSREKQIGNDIHPKASFQFADVKHAEDWGKSAKDLFGKLNAGQMTDWLEEHEPTLTTLDKKLNAAKYQVNGTTPSQRIMDAYNQRMMQLNKEQT